MMATLRNIPLLRKLFSQFPHLRKLLRAIDGCVVGGGVRNPLMGKPVEGELDLATPRTPQSVMRIGKSLGFTVVPIKLDHGTVLLVRGDEKYEVTTLRRDVLTDGRWAKIAYTRSWHQDSCRRDFTMNAMYMDARGKIYDYNGGLHDLVRGVLRFVGDPVVRIQEDYLRIVRMFRFWAYYAMPSLGDLQAASSLKDGLGVVSKERILAEMLKLYCAPSPWSAISGMCSAGIVVHSAGNELCDAERRFGRRLSALTRLAMTVDTAGWPLSRAQKRWINALKSAPQTFEDILELMYQFGVEFGLDCSMLLAPGVYNRVHDIHMLPECPVLPSELPVSPGPEMGARYKAVCKWWSRKWPAPSKEDCLAWDRLNNPL
jgi:poly(A) polymerase